ncbi:hypothetical protein [Rathayibacter tritici]|uniref:hypothetical protein n=1 Tax=Rathayibacter tritici TaxID=33888 RepID=UPI0011B0192B|nr:hypothetical protein [Rathayibacter tritici]
MVEAYWQTRDKVCCAVNSRVYDGSEAPATFTAGECRRSLTTCVEHIPTETIGEATSTRVVSVLAAHKKSGVGKTTTALCPRGTRAALRGGSVSSIAQHARSTPIKERP